jgi:Flp pilus assembly protein TadD
LPALSYTQPQRHWPKISGKPDLQRAYWYRGTIYLNAGDNGKAITDLTMAIQLDPKDAKALYARGLAKRKNGDATGSDADMAAAKTLDPDVEKRM